MLLETSRILVTGATGGIGKTLCNQLIARGARVLATGRRKSTVDSLAQTLPEAGLLDAIACDLDLAESRETLRIAADQHAINVLINLHGRNELALFQNQRAAAIESLFQSNLISPVLLIHALLPALMKQPPACILNVGSVFGSIGHPGYATYCATKFGLRGFSEALGRELAGTGVSVCHVAPRATRTAMNSGPADALNAALGNRVDDPDWVAGQIIAALVRERPRTTLGWPERAFARINQLFPGVIDRGLHRNRDAVQRIAAPSLPSGADENEVCS